MCLVVHTPFSRCIMTLAKYLRAKLTTNKLTFVHVGKRTGLHPQSIRAYCYGEYEPRMKNLIALLEVIAEAEKRCPRQVIYECISHIDEVTYAVHRSRKWLNKEESDR